MVLDDLFKVIKEYNPDEIERVTKAYKLAEEAHKDQKRESGEPYIIHPLNVCMNLTKFHADGATLCAGLLHDVVEDTKYTLEDIENMFDKEVAHLVDGVTKISNIHFNSKDEASNHNIRRLINSLNDDTRIIIIKLCDRLHNMQTLIHKAPEKRIRSAEETLNIFVPLAYFIGAYRIKCDLEDICLSYLDPQAFKEIDNKRNEVMESYQECLDQVEKDVAEILKDNNIKYESRIKILNVFQIYKKINNKYKISDIHDLVNLKISVETEDECYRVLGLIHRLYTPINNKFKDYIACPKTNMYQSLHTTVIAPCNKILQVQIKTKDMDNKNTFGLGSYWMKYKGEGYSMMQKDLIKNYQFFATLQDLNEITLSDKDFIEQVKKEVFTSNIYVYTLSGEIVELPLGATAIDFAYKIHTDYGNHLYKVYVNGKEVKITHKLKDKDRIFVVKKDSVHPQESWLANAITTNAIRKIKESLRKDN